jgi:hypothetical protein
MNVNESFSNGIPETKLSTLLNIVPISRLGLNMLPNAKPLLVNGGK